MLFSSAPEHREVRVTRVAVTSTKDDGATACLINNYNRLQIEPQTDSSKQKWDIELDTYYEDRRNSGFEREENDARDMKAWEAGLATSAAPFYFRPFVKEETGKDYVDGALHSNLPISDAVSEAKYIWPELQSSYPDILLSVGTGIEKRK